MKAKIKNKGFSLAEAVVAVAIFTVVISVVLSLFMIGLRNQRKVIALQNVQDNARFLLGFIGKEIRMSEINSVSSTILNITRSDGQDIIYTFDGQNIQRTVVGVPEDSGLINSDEILVDGSFDELGLGTGDNQQPRVTIAMKIETVASKKEAKAEINIQTTLNPRNLEYE